MKKLIGIVIVATTIGAPAFAQSYQASNRTGNWFTGSTVAAAPARAHSRTVSRHLGEQSYAMSPRRNIYDGYLNYDNTGGGSPGYNQLLMTW